MPLNGKHIESRWACDIAGQAWTRPRQCCWSHCCSRQLARLAWYSTMVVGATVFCSSTRSKGVPLMPGSRWDTPAFSLVLEPARLNHISERAHRSAIRHQVLKIKVIVVGITVRAVCDEMRKVNVHRDPPRASTVLTYLEPAQHGQGLFMASTVRCPNSSQPCAQGIHASAHCPAVQAPRRGNNEWYDPRTRL